MPPPAVGSSDAPVLRGRVPVVDDSEDAADSLALVLRGYGIEVDVAYDGASAVTTADAARPAAIVLDLVLPDRSGIDGARDLRLRPWGAATAIVAVTGWAQSADRANTEAAGCDAHLVKPVSADELLRVLERVGGAPSAERAARQ